MTPHRFDPVSFIFGAVFVAVAIIGLVEPDLLSFTDLRWIAPGALVVLGGLLLALSGRARDADDDRDVEAAASAGAVTRPASRAAGGDAPPASDGATASDGAPAPDADAPDPDERATTVDTAVEGGDTER